MAAPLLTPLVVTTADSTPAAVGFVLNVTVSEVAVAAVTDPTAPLLNVTLLLLAVVSNPEPLIVTRAAFAARFVTLEVTVGLTVATLTADPLLTPLLSTTAFKSPAVGFVEKVTVNSVAVAVETVPTRLSQRRPCYLRGSYQNLDRQFESSMRSPTARHLH